MGQKRDSTAWEDPHATHDDSERRSAKKRRTFTEEDVKLAGIYDKLASDDVGERLTSASELIRLCQSLYNTGEKSIMAEQFTNPIQTAEKIEGRLLRGLCSSRKSARIGFSLALTEVLILKLQSDLTCTGSFESRVDQYLQQVELATRSEYGASTQEKKDYALGRLFALSSLVESRVLVSAVDNEPAILRVFETLCDTIQQATSPLLAEQSGLICCELVRILSADKSTLSAVTKLLDIMNDKGIARSREGVAVWIELQAHFPRVTVPHNIWAGNSPLSRKAWSALIKALHTGTSEGNTKDTTGARQQRPHFVWKIVLRALATKPTKAPKAETLENKNANLFQSFWTDAVDSVYFTSTASTEKKALGFQLFTEALSFLPSDALPHAFSPKLMKCLINSSAQPDRYLHAVAKHLLNTFVYIAETRSELAPIIFTSLTSGSGDLNFDSLTKSKTVFDLLCAADIPAMMLILRQYSHYIIDASRVKKDEANAFRQRVADQLVSLVKHKTDVTKEKSALCQQPFTVYRTVIQYFTEYGFFRSNLPSVGKEGGAMVIFSEATGEMFRGRLLSCLTYLTAKYPAFSVNVLNMALEGIRDLSTQYENGRAQPIATMKEISSDNQSIIPMMHTGFYHDICAMEIPKETNNGHMDMEVPSTLYKAMEWENTEKRHTDPAKRRRHTAFTILFSLALLQAYSGEADALEMLQELEQAYPDEIDGADQAIRAMTDIILTFCSQQSALSRQLAEQAFRLIISDLGSDAVEALTNVLKQPEGLIGQQALFGANGDAGSDDGSEDDSDVQEVEEGDGLDDDGVDSGGESDEMESEDEDDSDDGSDAGDDEVAEFEAKLAGALRTTRPASGNAAQDNDEDDDSSSDDSLMDDDQMLALDVTISTMFRQRAGGAPGSSSDARPSARHAHKEAKQNVLAFKNRALSLLTMYLKEQYKSSSSLKTIMPLLEVIRTTRSAQLSARASALLLDTYFPLSKKKGLPLEQNVGDAETLDLKNDVLPLFEAVHAETRKWISREHVKCGSRACLFLVRVALAMGERNDEKSKKGEAKRGRRRVVERIDGVYEGEKEEEERPEWQEMLWTDWEVFRRQVVDKGEKRAAGKA